MVLGLLVKKFVEIVFRKYKPKKVIVFSRDELKQYEMQHEYNSQNYPISYFLGDIRDEHRLLRAFEGVDYVVHAAALKQVPVCERNPFEAIKTNVIAQKI